MNSDAEAGDAEQEDLMMALEFAIEEVSKSKFSQFKLFFKDMNNEIMEANRMEQVQTTYEPYAEVCDSPSQMHNDNDSFGGDSYAAYSVSEPSLYILNAKRFL